MGHALTYIARKTRKQRLSKEVDPNRIYLQERAKGDHFRSYLLTIRFRRYPASFFLACRGSLHFAWNALKHLDNRAGQMVHLFKRESAEIESSPFHEVDASLATKLLDLLRIKGQKAKEAPLFLKRLF